MAVHRKLLERMQRRDLFYVYDSLASSDSLVRDWSKYRLLPTSMIKRIHYFVGFSPASLAGPKSGKMSGDAGRMPSLRSHRTMPTSSL
jgi:hypothetical protein